jgi:DHA3 family macrolide efflux protein-like MFS transporter
VSPPESAEVAPPTVDDRTWVRNITIFLTGQTVSLLGSSLVQYAVLWYLTLTTKDGTVLALAIAFGFVPQALVSIFGGVWADRHNRKYLIMVSDACIAIATLALALFMMSGVTSLWLIFAVMAVRSAGAGIQTPAVGAAIPQIVPAEKLMRVNGVHSTIQSVMMLAAPPLAAVLYANLELHNIFFIDVVTAVIGIGIMAFVPLAAVARSGEPVSYFGDLREGVQYIWSHSYVKWVLYLFGGLMIVVSAPAMLTPLMVVRSFGEEVWKLTALELAFSIGMLLAGAAIAVWGDRFQRTTLIVWSTVILAALTVALGLSPVLWVFLLMMFLVGVSVPFFSTPIFTVLQESVEPERLGRVFGFVGIVSAVGMPLGMLIFGPLADVISVEAVLVIAGILMFGIAALAFLTPSGRAALTYVREHRPSGDPEGAEEADAEAESEAPLSEGSPSPRPN